MDCAECTDTVRKALQSVDGVRSARVLLAAERAIVDFDAAEVPTEALVEAVQAAGYQVAGAESSQLQSQGAQRAVAALGLVFAGVVLLVVLAEALGIIRDLTALVPWWAWLSLIVLAGYPVFTNVIRAAMRREVIAHSLMSLGVLAAMAVGEWATAVIVVFFMRVGEWVEGFTASRARVALQSLASLSPESARIVRGGQEVELPLDQVNEGDKVLVKPGERIPVDGEVTSGQATVDASAVTGESMPVEAGPGSRVFAASLVQLGSLELETLAVGPRSTFGRALQMAEEAEANRGQVQRLADRFSGYYLPLVAGIALLTYVIGGNALAAASVLVVACSCSFALATPIAMVASIGRAAQHGLLIKGGRYLEALAQVDVLLIDKTGTLTLGQPAITEIEPLAQLSQRELLHLAASVERRSEHPLAQAVLEAASQRNVPLAAVEQFQVEPGLGVQGSIEGRTIRIGRAGSNAEALPAKAADMQRRGLSTLLVWREGELLGVLGARDQLRPEVPAAIDRLRRRQNLHIEILTGDHEQAVAGIAAALSVSYRAQLLPEQKIDFVRQYQAQGRRVAMIGDGINDAPALAQADVGLAMGAAGTGVALEAAHIALMRDDWELVPEAFELAQRTMAVVRSNLIFTGIYNIVGISLAAVGVLPPIWAAAAQSFPDLGILGNSSRLLRG
jgi:Cd2+/Zn2+-exporting ATPase/Cu+-exporting ATPase